MPNLAAVLKDEVARLARKEIKRQTASMQKASAQHRRDIAALKRQAAGLERQLAQLEKLTPAQATPAVIAPEEGASLRFTAKGLRSQRKRLGLSAGAYAKLAGVTPQSIYNWERGTTRPRQSQIATLAALRAIGKKEVKAKLSELTKAAPAKNKTPAKKSAKKEVARKKAATKKKAAPKKRATAKRKANA